MIFFHIFRLICLVSKLAVMNQAPVCYRIIFFGCALIPHNGTFSLHSHDDSILTQSRASYCIPAGPISSRKCSSHLSLVCNIKVYVAQLNLMFAKVRTGNWHRLIASFKSQKSKKAKILFGISAEFLISKVLNILLSHLKSLSAVYRALARLNRIGLV